MTMIRITRIPLICILLGSVNLIISQTLPYYNSCTFWLKADSLVTYNISNEVISWESCNSSIHILTPAGSASPIFDSSSVINNKKTVHFNNSTLNINPSLYSDSGTLFMVFHPNQFSFNIEPILGNSSVNSRIFLYTPNSLRFTNGGTIQRDYDNALTENFQLVSATYNFPQSLLNLRCNFAPKSPTYFGTPLFFDFNQLGLNDFDGSVSEIIFYDRVLNISEINMVENYLSDKYIKKVQLPSDIFLTSTFCDTLIAVEGEFKSYLWSTGDTTPQINIEQTGEYWVQGESIFGTVSSDTIQVNFPVINSLSTNFICQNDSIIWNTSLNNLDYLFEWQNGSTDSLYVINQPGQYWVKVTDTLGCFRYSDTLTITIDSFPSITTLGPNIALCSGNSIALQQGASEAISYLWSDGSTNDSLEIISSGQYWVSASNANGCVAIDTIDVTVSGIAPTANFTTTGFCEGNTINFTDASIPAIGDTITTWVWNFGDSTNSSTQNPLHAYDTAGTYSVQLYVETDAGCGQSITQTINILTKPEALITVNTTERCTYFPMNFSSSSTTSEGLISYLKWDFGVSSADTSLGASSTFTYDTPGNYTLSLMALNSLGCKDTAFKTITINPSPTSAFIFGTACQQDSIQFSDNSIGVIDSWNWNFGNGNSSVLSNPKNVYVTAGTYNITLMVTDINGCQNIKSIPINVLALPQPNYTNQDFCLNSPNILRDNSISANGGIEQIYWQLTSDGDLFSQSSDTILYTPTADTPIFLTLEVIDEMGCKNKILDTLQVYPLPSSGFSFTPLFGNPPLEVYFTNESEDNIYNVWDFNGEDTSHTENATYIFQDTGIMAISLVVQTDHLCVDTITKFIQIGNLKYDIALSDIIPIWDSQNELLKPKVILENQGNTPVYNAILKLDIYNQNGISESFVNEDGLFPGEKAEYIFNSSIQLRNNIFPENICIRGILENIVETNLINNTVCLSFADSFYISKVYPNPAKNLVFIELFSIKEASTNIYLINDLGMIVSKMQEPIKNGLNTIPISTHNLSEGFYILKMEDGENSFVRKIEIIRD